MKTKAAPIQDLLAALADPTRVRLLLLLDRRELSVGELCTILQLPQSTVSRHLKALTDTGWAAVRAEGTSNVYTMALQDADASARRLWTLVREQAAETPAAAQDQRRLQSALAERRSKSQEFFSSSAGQWDRLRQELFGDRFHLAALAAFADPGSVIGDLGCGTGQVSEALAPFAARVIAIDSANSMLQAARKRLQRFDNVELRRGELEALPIDDGWLDSATMMLVLHHIPDPDKVLREAARVLKPAGRLVLVDMLPHDREHYRQQMGHVWLGFSETQIERWMNDAGFSEIRIVALAPDAKSKGPALFVAVGRKA
jgi:ubiquinone/menaquinone biosynthesis C-methylase UbiE/DNA-binding transcriptional ArsR family regulator